MPAHNILPKTIIGFVSPWGLKYVTKYYDVADLTTGEIVSTGCCGKGTAVDAYAAEVADHTHAVYGCDIADGISMTVARRNAKPSQNIGIAITTMRTGRGDGWSIVETLAQSDAVRLMHKWYIEHGLMDLYARNKYTAISGFQEWVCGKLIEFFSANNKFQWYGHVMALDYEIEATGCDFTECLCDTKVPSENRRHVVPNQFYDRFGLLNYATRMALWAKGKPETSQEADMILHKARLEEAAEEEYQLMAPILRKAAVEAAARRAGQELDKKAVQELLAEGNAIQDKEDIVQQRKEDTKTLVAAFTKKHAGVLEWPATGGGGGLTFDGPVKYIDTFRGQQIAERRRLEPPPQLPAVGQGNGRWRMAAR
jgi:hypothetical protein